MWDKEKKNRRKATAHIEMLEDMILCALIYYRTYITHPFLGVLFNSHNSNICQTFEENGAIIGQKITIKKDRSMTPERILKILGDVTEQPIQRPKDSKKRKKSYSGKKKTITMKTEIVIEENGQILSVSKSHRGRMHDFRIRKQEKLLTVDSIKYADSVYQEWQKLQSNILIPYKKTANGGEKGA